MELKRAKEVLEERLFPFDKTLLSEDGKRLFCRGFFTAEQYEAIATWMRDPEGVVGA